MGAGLLASDAITSLVGDKDLQAELNRALSELRAAIRPGREIPSQGVRAGLKESLAEFQRKFPELTDVIHNSGILGPARPSPESSPVPEPTNAQPTETTRSKPEFVKEFPKPNMVQGRNVSHGHAATMA